LLLHPDKNPGDQEAVAKFQSLQKVYTILGDPERRKIYDQTGETDEDLMGEKFTEVYDYFRAMYKQVTSEDLDNFYDAYRGSDEERADLLRHYSEFKGDMGKVFEWLMCSDPDLDSHRFMDAIQAAIDAGDVQKHKRFSTWAKQVAQRPQPSNPLAKRSSKKSQGGSGQLALPGSNALAQIREKRAKQADAFFDQLAEKYSSKPGSSKKRKAREEPTDEEFAAIQQRLGLCKAGQAEGSQWKGKGDKKSSSSKHVTEAGAKMGTQETSAKKGAQEAGAKQGAHKAGAKKDAQRAAVEGASGKQAGSKAECEGGSKRRQRGVASD